MCVATDKKPTITPQTECVVLDSDKLKVVFQFPSKTETDELVHEEVRYILSTILQDQFRNIMTDLIKEEVTHEESKNVITS